MVKTISFILLFISSLGFSQIRKDLDHDGIKDFIELDQWKDKIICRLSSQKFMAQSSKELSTFDVNEGIRAKKNGFEYYFHHKKTEYSAQFRFDSDNGKIKLIGMKRRSIFPDVEGSGTSSVNLLTHQYKGQWNYFDSKKKIIVESSMIDEKMNFPEMWLNDFDELILFEFADQCSRIYFKHKIKN